MVSLTIDAGLNGLLNTLSARIDGCDDELAAWLDEIGADALSELATTDEDVWTYFEVLASDGDNEALTFIGGYSKYDLTVGRACDRAEDAFVAWRACRPLTPLGPRLRSSALSG